VFCQVHPHAADWSLCGNESLDFSEESLLILPSARLTPAAFQVLQVPLATLCYMAIFPDSTEVGSMVCLTFPLV
jgi:hypothetical protein